jgi:hypothetical protein
MKFISSVGDTNEVDKKDVFEINLNKLGRPIDSKEERVFAKSVASFGQPSKYAILVFNNQPYDPYGADSHRESNLRLELKQVSQQTHTHYISYLKTKNQLYMIRTQRSFING